MIHFNTPRQSAPLSLSAAENTNTMSGEMFPPAPGVIFDYLMLNTPSDASCTPLALYTATVQPDRREEGDNQNQTESILGVGW